MTMRTFPLTRVFFGAGPLPLQKHRLETLAVLLQGGAEPNLHASGTGNTHLHLAVRSERAGGLSRTALHLAITSGTAHAEELILVYGADRPFARRQEWQHRHSARHQGSSQDDG